MGERRMHVIVIVLVMRWRILVVSREMGGALRMVNLHAWLEKS